PVAIPPETVLGHHVPTDDEIEGIRKAGAQVAAYKTEVNKIARVIEGLEWGAGNSLVRGSSLSPQTRYAMAEFCRITRANPMSHVDVLGGKPYLNAAYWVDLLNSHQHFHHYEQRDLSPSVEQALRDRAARHREAAKQLEASGNAQEAALRVSKALDMEDEADDIALARAQWSPRDTATVVIETTIYRFMNAAPIEAIRRGEITDFERYLVAVPECNWAGGMGSTMASAKKSDPIGDANPGTTARTRSIRRAGTKAFSAWMQPYEAQIEKAERAVEAEWEIIQEDAAVKRAALPSPNGPQAVSTAGGEPTAAAPHGARDLPTGNGNGAAPAPAAPPANHTPEAPPAAEFDLTDARKRFFASLRDAGIAEDDRKPWCERSGLPTSTKEWGQAEFERAQELLVGPAKKKVEEGCKFVGVALSDLSLRVLGKEAPEFLRDWNALADELSAAADQKLL
ncbi:MAG: hypothetical protein OEZ65_15930, partial [Gemmatimonadota bacterium]|nr:hypothetical protein [Gemmatimonadota bacterium]